MSAVSAERFHEALVAAGVVRRGDRIRRVVIGAQMGHALVMHVERIGDSRLLDVVPTLDGVQIKSGQGGYVEEPLVPADDLELPPPAGWPAEPDEVAR
jgi:hypothetical protein